MGVLGAYTAPPILSVSLSPFTKTPLSLFFPSTLRTTCFSSWHTSVFHKILLKQGNRQFKQDVGYSTFTRIWLWKLSIGSQQNDFAFMGNGSVNFVSSPLHSQKQEPVISANVMPISLENVLTTDDGRTNLSPGRSSRVIF